MSHIIAHKSKIALINRTAIKEAIRLMEKEFPGIRFEEKADMILVRGYAPIEVYQKNGNLRFVLSDDGKTFEAHYDYWNCGAEMKRTIAAFENSYAKASVIGMARKFGFTAGQFQKTATGERMIAQKW